MFSCQGISRRFGQAKVLSDIGFSLQSGEILGIIGPNGAGKTTLMECLTGLAPCEVHSLRWQGRSLCPEEARRYLYYLPDGILPYPDHPVAVVLRFFQQLYGAGDEHHAFLVGRLGLESVLNQRVHTLSKGYRRRLLLAVGLLSTQPLLLLDEPFDGFDLRQTLDIMSLLREMLKDRALLLCIHQLSEAEKICDRFLLLNEGQVVALGNLETLRAQAGLEAGGLEEVFLGLV
ncbi:ABC-2 type transporter ATP-binding protein [Thiolapillus brandeum]|uniref:ABC-2 type transporter ATP-binding protein n=1 Tax=Thiolapillus brandeum TaxID=1076588 RepID=A0A7U6GJW8_9GAMM|nr:ABC-2 type transporter ATP-binding protein [Thiolapillus brandeum]